MLEHAKRDRRPSMMPVAAVASVMIAILVMGTLFALDAPSVKPHTHPAADGVVTRAEIEAMLVQANAEYAKQRAAIEAVHVRVDKLQAGVKALAPELPGRARANALVEEAGR